ncbi:hypothetical protein [Psychrobacter sp. P2G3]|uniref:hypothetical protein n=1 Tax=Psychrobacter sp. P2G3 TaxID=1699622 RepID=UPI00078ED3AA|nr:hypothetical protein [Psychrobacter sp. P2G3]AMN49154.1 hypothetical protein AK823_04035 [Psychrobacter sp. P2G3]
MIENNKPTSDKKYPKSTEYKGRKIKFSDLPSSDLKDKAALEVEKRIDKSQKHLRKLKVEIDDKAFEVVELNEGIFESGLLPYSSYSSPVELAQDVIDYITEFKK